MSENNGDGNRAKCSTWGPGKRVLTPCTFLANGLRGDNGNVVGLTQLMLAGGRQRRIRMANPGD